MNFKLNMDYSKKEVEEALKQMRPLKSPSLDGFGRKFFQKHLPMVSDAVYEIVLTILRGVGMESSLNSTLLI